MSDEIFDPEIHAVDKDGNPSLNKDGSFRKKRRDAGGGRSSAGRPRAARAASGGAGSRERYRKSVDDFLAIPVTVLSLKDPVLGYAAAEVAPLWSAGLADLAVERPEFAAALERVGGLGVVGSLLGLGVLTAVQFGHLAGKIPPHMVKMLGGKTREEIEQVLRQRGEQLARAQGAAEHARAEAPAEGVRVMAHA